MTQQQGTSKQKSDSTLKHVISFVVMIILTGIAFYLVLTNAVDTNLVVPIIIVLASIQVLLQLFIFMHLDQRGSKFYTTFMFLGVIIAVVSAVGIILM